MVAFNQFSAIRSYCYIPTNRFVSGCITCCSFGKLKDLFPVWDYEATISLAGNRMYYLRNLWLYH